MGTTGMFPISRARAFSRVLRSWTATISANVPRTRATPSAFVAVITSLVLLQRPWVIYVPRIASFPMSIITDTSAPIALRSPSLFLPLFLLSVFLFFLLLLILLLFLLLLLILWPSFSWLALSFLKVFIFYKLVGLAIAPLLFSVFPLFPVF